VTLRLVTLVILPTTMLQMYKTIKKSCERKKRKPHVTLWLANVTNHNVTQMLPLVMYQLYNSEEPPRNIVIIVPSSNINVDELHTISYGLIVT